MKDETQLCHLEERKSELNNLNHFFCSTHNSDFHTAETNPKICWVISHQNYLNTEILVNEIPKCDFCEMSAKVDGNTKLGCWANLCEFHFKKYGIGLGLGKGQRLIVMEKNEKL